MKQSVIVFLQAHTSTQFLMVGKSSSMVGYHLMTEDHSIQQGVWGEGVLFKFFLNIALKKMFEKLKINRFQA